MKKILHYLFEKSEESNCAFIPPSGIRFTIGYYNLTIILEPNDESDDEFQNDYFIEDIELFSNFFLHSNIKEITISIYEEGLFENRDENDSDEKVSVANTVFQLFNRLSKVDLELVIDYEFKVNDPEDSGFCGYYPFYIGEIIINPQKVSFEIIEKIVQILLAENAQLLGELYFPAFTKQCTVKNIFTEQFLNTNTKVRRLGYLKLFFKFINEKKKIPESLINKKFESYTLPFSSELDNLTNKRGLIQNLDGQSAEPYITLLKEMDLITTINRVIVPTKWLKTFLVIRDNFVTNSETVFYLDELDKLFFLEVILKKDFLYSSIILEFLFIREKITTQDLIKKFQSLLLNKLKKLAEQSTYKNEKAISKIRDIDKRVSSWKKAEVYLEHIIMPRINWLTDLGLLTFTENNIEVTNSLKRLVIELNSWIDIRGEYVADSSDFLMKYYPHIYAKTNSGNYGHYPDEVTIINLCDEYIYNSFSLFKTLAPNRVTSSQAFTFAKYCIYLKNGISVSESFISRIVEEKLSHKYIYKYQSRYGDGYIQKINSN
jgi:hypothetical protein